MISKVFEVAEFREPEVANKVKLLPALFILQPLIVATPATVVEEQLLKVLTEPTGS